MLRLKSHASLGAALGLLWLTTALFAAISSARTAGHVGYALDDAYIPMAIAKNLVDRRTWGVTPFEFSASSSSLAWPLILAALRLVGLGGEKVPLIVNLLLASATLVGVSRYLNHFGVGGARKLGVLLASVLLTPMPALLFVGLEHSLQLLVTTCFIFASARCLEATSDGRPPSGTSFDRQLLLLAPLVTAARYEGLFVLAVVSALLVLQRRWGFVALVSILGVLPVVAFGLLAMSRGGLFLPNSVMLKASLPPTSLSGLVRFLGGGGSHDYVGIAAMYKNGTVALFALGIVVYVFAWRRTRRLWSSDTLPLLILLFTMTLHMQFARYGWFYRYEAYLVLGWLVAVPVALRGVRVPRPVLTLQMERTPVYALALLLAVTVALPTIGRAARSYSELVGALQNIFTQQYQMGEFARRYYNGKGVVANDIGAIDYLADVHLVDLSGLATIEIARTILEETLTADMVDSIAGKAEARVAMVYEKRLADRGLLPPSWVKVGELTIENNVVCGDATVAFFAVTTDEVSSLRAHLREFARLVPTGARLLVNP